MTSVNGVLGLGIEDARRWDNPPGWTYIKSRRDKTENWGLPASMAGFGWESNSFRKSTCIYIRYWVVVTLATLLAAASWRRWRFRLRTTLVVLTILAVMLGISARSHQLELRARNAKPVIKVEYDWGTFSDNLPPISKAALERGTDLELYSLNPFYYEGTTTDYFHDWMVLGKTPVNDIQSRRKLLAAFNAGVKQGKEMEEMEDCFIPRHGLRVKLDGQTIDFVIDLECGEVWLYVGRRQPERFVTSPTPQPEFDRVLTAAGVELAPSPTDWDW